MSALTLVQRLSCSLTKPAMAFGPSAARGGFVRPLATTSFRDPERPKKNSTAWLLYLSDYRKTAPKDLKGKEVMSEAASKWKTLANSEKQPYESKAAEEKKKYEAAMKEYTDSGKKEAWKRDPAKPVRPLSGFMRYAQEARNSPDVKDLKMTEQTKVVGEKWRALTPTQKKPYEEAAHKEAEAYKEALQKYKDSGKEEAWLSKTGRKALSDSTAAQKAKAKAQKAVEKAKKALKKATANRKAADNKMKAAVKAAEQQEKVALKNLEKAKSTEVKDATEKAKEAAKKALTKATEALKKSKTKLTAANTKFQAKLDDAIKKEVSANKLLVEATKEEDKAHVALAKAKAEVKKHKDV